MDIRSIAWASVPGAPALVQGEDGEWCVERGIALTEAPADSSLLSDFLEIRPGEHLGEDVLAFVRRHGLLNVCREHQVTQITPGHCACERLSPEPLALWAEHVKRVGSLVRRWVQLEEGEDPYDLTHVEEVFRKSSLRLEKDRRELQSRGVHPEVVRAYVDGHLEARDSVEGRLMALREEEARLGQLARTLGPADHRRALASDLDEALGKHQPVLGVLVGESGSLVRVLDVYGVLPRLYFDLAAAMASERTTFVCSVCGGPYQPKRRPKRGQANYCPRCREGGAARRRSNRRSRAKSGDSSG